MRTVKIALQQAQPRLASSDPLRFAARAGRTARGLFPCAATSTLAGRARAGETTALSPAPCARTGWRVGWGWGGPPPSLPLLPGGWGGGDGGGRLPPSSAAGGGGGG